MRATQVYPKQALGLSTAHNCTLTTYHGGQYAELRPPERTGRAGGGGPRGHITEFSKASRRRLQKVLASVDQGRISVPLFVTLTYPREFPGDPQICNAHLRAFRERLTRRFGKAGCLWRKEYQKRGAPHYHLLLFLAVPPEQLRSWVSESWYQIVGSGDERHLCAGTQVVRVKSWRGARGYAAKYLGKLEPSQPTDRIPPFQGAETTGRLWGVWYRALLPITADLYYASLRQFYRLRRCFRRLSGQRSTHRTIATSCFVSHATAVRLLEHVRSRC
jgi:hypothetical protein